GWCGRPERLPFRLSLRSPGVPTLGPYLVGGGGFHARLPIAQRILHDDENAAAPPFVLLTDGTKGCPVTRSAFACAHSPRRVLLRSLGLFSLHGLKLAVAL